MSRASGVKRAPGQRPNDSTVRPKSVTTCRRHTPPAHCELTTHVAADGQATHPLEVCGNSILIPVSSRSHDFFPIPIITLSSHSRFSWQLHCHFHSHWQPKQFNILRHGAYGWADLCSSEQILLNMLCKLYVMQSLNWGSCIVWHSIAKNCFALYNFTCFLLRHAVYVDYLYL